MCCVFALERRIDAERNVDSYEDGRRYDGQCYF